MTVLGVIFVKATVPRRKTSGILEYDASICWEKTYHLGEPRKAHHQRLSDDEVPGVPPGCPQRSRYEFLWGPGAHAETSKENESPEFLAKVASTVPSALSQYEEALRDEERARATVPAGLAPLSLPGMIHCHTSSSFSTLPKGKDFKDHPDKKM